MNLTSPIGQDARLFPSAPARGLARSLEQRRLQFYLLQMGIEIGALGVVRRDSIGLATLLVATGPLGFRSRVLKRGLDIVVSLGALIVALPILALAALAIKLEDGGPILFHQRRIGRRNKLFAIHKLRSMGVDQSDADGRTSASKGDKRLTRVGAFLRKSSIDELPQLFNVLKGDMSLVGPRPHAIGSLAGDKLFWEVDERYWHRHSLRPGLTGLAQVRGFRGGDRSRVRPHRQAAGRPRLSRRLDHLARHRHPVRYRSRAVSRPRLLTCALAGRASRSH